MDAADVALERFVADGGLAAMTPIGEGAAMLVLERTAHARARGARALAAITDSRAMFRPDPPDAVASGGFAAAGVCELLARLEQLGVDASATVTAWCPSGHGAAVVVQRLA